MADSLAAFGTSTPSGEDPAFEVHLRKIIHEWMLTLTALGFTLVPLFFLLDIVIVPAQYKDLLPRFGYYRLGTTWVIFLQYWIVRWSKPTRRSHWHGYVFTLVISVAIAKMTT